MILLKIKLKLLLFSIITLAIISCGDENKAKTVSITVSTGEIESISRGVLGTYDDITDVTLDIVDASGKYYAKGQPFNKITDRVDAIWTITVDNVPVNLDLNFTASAYDINDTKIFKGREGKKLTLQSAKVFIDLFPISDGISSSITKIISVIQKDNGIILNIEDDANVTEVLYKIDAHLDSSGFTKTTGKVPLSGGKGKIELTYRGYKSGTFTHDITLNNQIGGVAQTIFTTIQNSDADVIIGVAPTVNGISFKRISDNKLQAELNVSDDKSISNLRYFWSFNGNSNLNIENNATNPITINDFNDSIEGTLIAIVTDEHDLSYTYQYDITVDQFKTNSEFKVSSTSVDDNKILSNENLIILFNKNITISTANNSSIFISNGIRLVKGSFSFPKNNKVVFTPNEQWKANKNYSLNIKSNLLDSNGNALGVPVVVEFESKTLENISTLKNGLVAHYEFEDNAHDSSGNNNHGVTYGASSYVNGTIGKGIRLNGILSQGGHLNPDRIKVNNSNSLKFNKYATFSYWVNIKGDKVQTSANCSGNAISGKSGVVFGKSGEINGIISKEYDSDIIVGFQTLTGGKGGRVSDIDSAYSKFRFTTVVFNSDTNSIKFYVNGVFKKEVIGNYNFSSSNNRDLYIGVSYNRYVSGLGGACLDYWYPLDGIIDDFRIYNRELMDEEISALYNLSGN